MLLNDKIKIRNFKTLNINFGPQHPAAHGVLRILLELKGEVIKKIDPHIGLLHRGTEKLLENKIYIQGLPYFDRLDYVSMMIQEHGFCLVLEKIKGTKISYRAKIIRIIFSELTRLLNHLLSLTTHALDVGAMTPFLWGFEEREKIFSFYEKASGARMHAAFFKPGGLSYDIPLSLLKDIYIFCKQFSDRISEIEEFLTLNRIWTQRLKNIGVITKKFINDWSLSGVMLRGSGICWDLRKTDPYELYNFLNFKTIVGIKGDCYERYLLRIEEMRQSISIITQSINLIKNGPINVSSFQMKFNNQFFKYDMEKLILHFKRFTRGFLIKPGSTYVGIEAPKGEFGVFLKSIGENKPYRCKIRAPGFFHLQCLLQLSKNIFLSDLVTLIGTCDVVLGEIDR
jgi:NADH dehydrogenase (ubiquinone) Fe-S protein 2